MRVVASAQRSVFTHAFERKAFAIVVFMLVGDDCACLAQASRNRLRALSLAGYGIAAMFATRLTINTWVS